MWTMRTIEESRRKIMDRILKRILDGYIMSPEHRVWRVAPLVQQYKLGKIRPAPVDVYLWRPYKKGSLINAGHVAYRYSLKDTLFEKQDGVLSEYPTLDVYQSYLPDHNRPIVREKVKMKLPMAVSETDKVIVSKSLEGYEKLVLN